jgi:lipoprotein-anchoring transpeptidase ErfK/SrfK
MNRTTRVASFSAPHGYLVAFLLSLAIRAAAQSSASAVETTQSSGPTTLAPSRLVIVSIPNRQLAVLQGGKVIATFAVAVGAAESPSPTGTFQIVSRVSNPTYHHPGTVVPSGKNNPVGTRWVGLSQKGYGIHGTNAPQSIGHAASHGCIRLRNRDMERLFTLLHVGDAVEIHGERDEQIARIFGDVPEPAASSAQLTAGQ